MMGTGEGSMPCVMVLVPRVVVVLVPPLRLLMPWVVLLPCLLIPP
jgi:hypothetical protein